MAAMGFTLNQITMLALTLMVGIVIDDAIIVLENIFRFIEEKGMTPMQAAIEGTQRNRPRRDGDHAFAAGRVSACGFMGGIVGRFMSSFGFTSAFAIAVSLLVSFTLTPMLSSRFIKPPAMHARTDRQHSSKDSPDLPRLDVALHAHAEVGAGASQDDAGDSARSPSLSIVPLFMFVGKNFLPADDQSQFNVLVRTPEGTSLAATTALTEQSRAGYPQDARREHTLMTAGGGADASVNSASIYVKLTDLDQRRSVADRTDAASARAAEAISDRNSHRRGACFERRRQPEQRRNSVLHPGAGSGPLAEVFRRDDGEDERSIPGATDADTTQRSGKPEVRLVIDRPRAADLGVSVMDIEQALNTLVAGQVASTFNSGDDQYDVRVRAQEQFRTSARRPARDDRSIDRSAARWGSMKWSTSAPAPGHPP